MFMFVKDGHFRGVVENGTYQLLNMKSVEVIIKGDNHVQAWIGEDAFTLYRGDAPEAFMKTLIKQMDDKGLML